MWRATAPAPAVAADYRIPFPADGDSVSCIKFNGVGNMLAAGGWDGKVRIFIPLLPSPPPAMSF